MVSATNFHPVIDIQYHHSDGKTLIEDEII